MPFDFSRARPLLQNGDLGKLFVEELGWEPSRRKLTLRASERDFAFSAIAEKRGLTVWLCESRDGQLPDHTTRLKLDRALTQTSFEHLIVFITSDRARQSWLWVRREPGKPLTPRTHEFIRGQPGDSLLQKLQILYVSLEEEEAGLSTVAVAGRARAAFDIERVTKAFYRDFDTHRIAFLKFIDGIGEVADREWYASVMLNRMMFVYFIQRKGFLDADPDYLRHRLQRCQQEKGKDKFYTFYRYFLLRLFHEGFGKRRRDRAPELEKLLGNIPYLNGGLFDVHELEKPDRYGTDIQIPDKAFDRVFDFFEKWDWQLDPNRTVKKAGDKEQINPDVLGYIFEKYINQKQMGAYYTKEDITEYISKNTVLPFLFEAARAKCKVAFENPNGPTVWDLLRDNPDRYIYPAIRHGLTWNYIPDHQAKGELLAKPLDLPAEIAAGLDPTKPNLIERRKAWNKPAPGAYALPTEIWREVIARRQRYEEVRKKLAAGEVREVNDFITLNLDLRQFAQDVVTSSEGPELLRAVWHSIEKVTVLDPTCGSGAFLFAALNILEPLYESCLDRMEAFVADDDRMRTKSPEESIRELIASGESQFLEFKATARWNLREDKADKAVEQVITKTVAAFLNSSGGDLLIGVQDDGSILGIEVDQQLVNIDKRNRDFYENWLMTLLLGVYGKQYAANLRVLFARLGVNDVCRITVSPASTAVYVKENNEDALYVRAGNSTRRLTTSEAVAYHQQRFSKFAPPPVVAEPLKSSNPRKYADFRKVCDTVAVHHNRRYFVLKSIILNNLYGVDIMEEAVEICKLRLFLKLAAQIEPDTIKDNLGIEPLPDIDFNIRAGNTLVGYATYDEVKRAVTSSLDFDNTMDKIAVKAADLQQTFDKFRRLQTEGDGSVPAADKQELQKRLKTLEDELNRHLAGEYGVKLSDKPAYAKWLKSHQPFHWFIQFYGILNAGGFDVIIGNPPYVELNALDDYEIRGYSCTESGNLYALIMERCAALGRKEVRQGYIVPVSSVSTDRYETLQKLIVTREDHFSSYDDRPSRLFDGLEHIRLTIHLMGRPASAPRLFSTRYNKWMADERPALFSKLTFTNAMPALVEGTLPKLCSNLEQGIVQKLAAQQRKLCVFYSAGTKHRIFYSRKVGYFLQVLDFEPRVLDGKGKRRPPSEFKELKFANDEHAKLALCCLNSNLFYWFVTVFSDCRHINKRDVDAFPINLVALSESTRKNQLLPLANALMEDLQRHSDNRTMRFQHDTLTVQCIYPKASKPIIDKIDTVLAGHYGFTAEELDFILNYDIKYRMGRDAEGED